MAGERVPENRVHINLVFDGRYTGAAFWIKAERHEAGLIPTTVSLAISEHNARQLRDELDTQLLRLEELQRAEAERLAAEQ